MQYWVAPLAIPPTPLAHLCARWNALLRSPALGPRAQAVEEVRNPPPNLIL